MRLKQNPYHLLLLAGLVLVLTSFFPQQHETIDIHLHDTYYVIAKRYESVFLAFSVWVLWFLYLVTRNILYSKSLAWIHVIITLLTVFFFLFLLNVGGDLLNPGPGRYLDYSTWKTLNGSQQYKRWIVYIISALLLGQMTFFINLLAGIFKRVR